MSTTSPLPTPTLAEIIAGANDDATLLNCLEDVHDDTTLPKEARMELVWAIADRLKELHPREPLAMVKAGIIPGL